MIKFNAGDSAHIDELESILNVIDPGWSNKSGHDTFLSILDKVQGINFLTNKGRVTSKAIEKIFSIYWDIPENLKLEKLKILKELGT